MDDLPANIAHSLARVPIIAVWGHFHFRAYLSTFSRSGFGLGVAGAGNETKRKESDKRVKESEGEVLTENGGTVLAKSNSTFASHSLISPSSKFRPTLERGESHI